MKAIGYVRVSTPGQAEKGISLAAQQSRIQAMAMLQEAELIEVIVDAGESGKNLDRPGMKRLLALVEHREVDAVIIAKLDRLTRSVKDHEAILDYHALTVVAEHVVAKLNTVKGKAALKQAAEGAKQERRRLPQVRVGLPKA
jgi:site-specific DNA recombinase